MASPLESLTQICTACILNTCHPNWQSWSQEFSVRYLTLHSFHSLWTEHMAVIRLMEHKIRYWIIVQREGLGQEDIIQSQRVAMYGQFKNWVCVSEPCIMLCNLKTLLNVYGKGCFCIAIMGCDNYYQNIQTDVIQCPFKHIWFYLNFMSAGFYSQDCMFPSFQAKTSSLYFIILYTQDVSKTSCIYKDIEFYSFGV